MNSHRRLSRTLPLILVAVAATLLVSACGGAKKPPAASGSGNSAATNSAIKDAYRYSACMRTHGVTNFADPHVDTNGSSVQIAIHIDPAISRSPSFKSAQHACAHIMPGPSNGPTPAQTQAHTDAFLAFAKCMRAHGFPKFPDPDSQGHLSPAALSAAGINLQQPAFKPAAYACAGATHGFISKADINQAIANPSGGSQSAHAGG
jgi:hypothetical protein